MTTCPHFGSCGGCSRQDTPYEQQLRDKESHVRTCLKDFPVEEWKPILASPEQMFYRNKMEYSFGNEIDIRIFNGIGSPSVNHTVVTPPLAPPLAGRGTNQKTLGPLGRTEIFLEDSSLPREGEGQHCSMISSMPVPSQQYSHGGMGQGGGEEPQRNNVHIGLHPRKRFALVMPTPECQLLSQEGRAIQKIVTDWANQHQIASFTRKTAQGDLRHLVIREGKNTGERMVKLVAKSATPHVDDLAARLKASAIPITTFFWSVHDGLSDVAHGSENKLFWGDGTIQEKMGRVKVQVTPNSFLQTNTRAAEMMIEVLRGWMSKSVILSAAKDLRDSSATPQNDKLKLFDLYCGSGTIGLNLATDDMSLVGIETNSSAIDEARLTARENGFHNAEFVVGPVEKLIANHATLKANENAIVVVDPPRPGLHPSVVEALVGWAVPNLFYVSCNPESLARDLLALSSRYTIRTVQPMDFFPHTDHMETAVWLVRK